MSSIKNIILYFPVRGHSFLVEDHVIGRVEQNLAKNLTITSNQQYYEAYKKFGHAKILRTD